MNEMIPRTTITEIVAHRRRVPGRAEREGYPEARRCIMGMETPALVRAYIDAMRDELGHLPHNARAARRLYAEELIARGIVEIPSYFGNLEVCRSPWGGRT